MTSFAAREITPGAEDEYRITVTVNGERRVVEVEPRLLLAHLLREGLGLTGTHLGCDTTNCGACTVLVDGRPWLSCITVAGMVEGRRITTIEGLMPLHLKAGGSGPDPVQAAFDKCGALQCGFCQPGMMLSARALLDRNPCPTRPEIREALAGNLCRCTGYTQIFEAVELAVAEAIGVEPAPRSWEAQRLKPEEAQRRAREAAAKLRAERERSAGARGPECGG